MCAIAVALVERAKKLGLLQRTVSTRSLQRLHRSSHALAIADIRAIVEEVLEEAEDEH